MFRRISMVLAVTFLLSFLYGLILPAESGAITQVVCSRLFGTIGNGPDGGTGGTSTLVELNPTTGALIRTIGPVGYLVNGLDYDPISGKMYASTANNDSIFPRGLLTIDTTTGAGTPVGSGFGIGEPVTNIRADSTGALFGWVDPESDDLASINPVTGTASIVGESGLGTGAYGMSFNRAGTLYFVNYDGSIYTVNTVTGAATNTGVSAGQTAHHGDFNPDTDKYWGIDANGSGPKNLRVINITTGSVEQTLPTVDNLHTITFVPNGTFFDDMESGSAKWTMNGWAVTPGSAFRGNYKLHNDNSCGSTDESAWMTTPVTLSANSYLEFAHYYYVEGYFDNGRVEYSVDGGASWIDAGPLFVENGYNCSTTAMFGGPAFCGSSGGYITSRVDLNSLTGQNVQFRFRLLTDGSICYYGWDIDDVRICNPAWGCNQASFTVTPSAGAGGSIDPNTPQSVLANQTTSFTVTPDTGYHIDSVSGCGGTLVDNTYTTGAITADCTVSASYAINTYTVTPSAGAGGSLSPATPQTVNYNQTTSFTVTPNAHYHLVSVSGCGGTLEDNTYTTGAITAACTVSATFAIDTFAVTPSAGAGGSLSPSTPQTVNYNDTTSFTVTPNSHYHLVSVSGCGGTLEGNTYTTGAITAACTVNATFAIDTFAVTPSAGAGGSLSPATVQTVNYNSTTSFTVTPNSHYHLVSVSGCGGSLSGSTYTTGAITAACTVSATFAIDTFAVTPSAGIGGSISPATPQTINYGQTTSFTVTPEKYYVVESVSGCGGTLNGTTYTTGPITAACTVTASFYPTRPTAPPAYFNVSPQSIAVLGGYITASWGASPSLGAVYELELSSNGGAFTLVDRSLLKSWRFLAKSLGKGKHIIRVRAVAPKYAPSAWQSATVVVR